jgi:hypothetical protein
MSPVPQGSKVNLSLLLEEKVPLYISQVRDSGGPSSDDYYFLATIIEEFSSQGEAFLYYDRKRSDVMVEKMARAIAILSFTPGGISLFGKHWEEV